MKHRTERTIYYNGNRYVTWSQRKSDLAGAYGVYTTFAYRGTGTESLWGWPQVISYTIR